MLPGYNAFVIAYEDYEYAEELSVNQLFVYTVNATTHGIRERSTELHPSKPNIRSGFSGTG